MARVRIHGTNTIPWLGVGVGYRVYQRNAGIDAEMETEGAEFQLLAQQ